MMIKLIYIDIIIKLEVKNNMFAQVLKRQSRPASSNLSQLVSTQSLSLQQVRCFSAGAADAGAQTPDKVNYPPPSKEWGEKYSDEAYYFEKEWTEIARRSIEK